MEQIENADTGMQSLDHAEDPVCGMAVTKSPDTRQAEYKDEILALLRFVE